LFDGGCTLWDDRCSRQKQSGQKHFGVVVNGSFPVAVTYHSRSQRRTGFRLETNLPGIFRATRCDTVPSSEFQAESVKWSMPISLIN
jgi:hypothetical protein